MNADDVRAALQRAIEREGTAAAWCQKHEIARGYVSDVLSGRQEPGKAILDALGIEAVTTYRRIKK
jgi:hypothetical protein